jgi:signal peptidase
MSNNSRAKKVGQGIGVAILVIIIAGLVFVHFSPNYNMYVVRSGSMEPVINVGDAVVIGPLDGPFGDGLQDGSVVTYRHGAELITHRVLSIEGDALVTKGDAVEDPDPWPVTRQDIRGVYLFRIPYIGYASSFIRTPLGRYVAILVPGAILVALLFREARKRKKAQTQHDDEEVIYRGTGPNHNDLL